MQMHVHAIEVGGLGGKSGMGLGIGDFGTEIGGGRRGCEKQRCTGQAGNGNSFHGNPPKEMGRAD
jgi:hypothetical protein